MSNSIIYNKFRYANLKKFMESTLGTDSLYLGIGRPYYWNTVLSSDVTIPAPVNNVADECKDWEDMMALKRINYSDMSFGIKRLGWAAGNKYDMYRHDWDGLSIISQYDGITYPKSVSDSKFVVINASNNLFICLKQGKTNGSVVPSLYSPETGIAVGTNTGILKTADGYYWKFLANTGVNQYVQFATTAFFPVKTLTSAPQVTDPYYDQWLAQVRSATFKGGIYCINVSAQGSGYNGGAAGQRTVTDVDTDAQFKLYGNGTGLQCVVYYGTGGSIVDVEVTNPGHGYTFATIIPTGGTGASFEIIFTTPTGLGCDPVKDIDSTYMLISTTLDGAEGAGDFTIGNDYRKVSLISNPFNYNTTTIATATTLDATTTLNLTSFSGGTSAFGADGIITGSNSHTKGRTVDWNADLGYLRVIKTRNEDYTNYHYANGVFLNNEIVSTTNGVGTGTIQSITPPEVQSYTGDILYSEYRVPIQRAADQSETIRCIVQF